jgi:hypothetical protein
MVPWNELKKDLEAAAETEGFELTSYVEFDRHSSWMSVYVSNRDFEFFRQVGYEFEGDVMNFMITVVVAGSELQGSTIEPANLPQATFSIKFKDSVVANACAENKLNLLEITYEGEQRTKIDAVTMPDYDDMSTEPIVIKARKVKSTASTADAMPCSFVTETQVWREECEWEWDEEQATGHMVGCWEELRSFSPYVTVDLDSDQPTISLDLNQKWYLDYGQWFAYKYSEEDMMNTEYMTPFSINIKLRFHSYDLSNDVEANDVIELTFKSNHEDYADFCIWDDLEILEPIQNTAKTYDVASA